MQRPDIPSAFWGALVVVVLLAVMGPVQAQTIEATERSELRVCADGNMLPYSNRALEGFENKLAAMLAEELGIPVTYTWWPQTIGFVRNTLRARECDLIVGVNEGNELVLNTNPYYHSTYVIVYRSALGIEIDTLAHPLADDLRFGVVEKTPAMSLLQHYGYRNFQPYQLTTDTRAHQPSREAIEDVARGAVDAAIVWGPIAGYYAPRQSVPLTVVPLLQEPKSVRLDFHITMGVRHGELIWKHRLNDFLRTYEAEIQALLLDYGVPLLDHDGGLLGGKR